MESTDRIQELEQKLRLLESQNQVLKSQIANQNFVEIPLFQSIFLNIQNACIIYSAIDNGTDFNIILVNPAFERLENVHKTDILGKKVSEAFPEANKGILEIFSRVFRSGIYETYVFKYQLSDKSIVYRSNNIFKLASGEIVAIYEDITPLKVKEDQLKQSEARFRAFFENNTAAMLQIDPITKNIINANEAASRFYGYNHEEFKKLKAYDINILAPDEIDQKMIQVMTSSSQTFIFQHRLANGESREVEVYVSPITTETEKQLFLTIYDVSEREANKRHLEESKAQLARINKTLEEKVNTELRRSREKDHLLIQQSRHAVLGEMIGNIAHQWRQPLNEVAILINDLEDAFTFGVLNKAYFEKTMKTVYRRLKFMSNTIDDFSKMYTDDFKKETFSPKSQIEKLIQFATGSSQKNKIQIRFMFDEDFEVLGYPNMLSHVLFNMLNNSRDIFVERKIEKPEIWIKLEKRETDYCITLLDNGKGIDGEIIDKIFDPYFTTKNTKKGSGLGLYMAKSMIEKQMDGQIEIQNQREGAEFKITLHLKSA